MKYDDKSTISRESDKFMLRLPDGMRERIAEHAKRNGRSMNSEIVARLQASLDGEQGLTDIEKNFFLHVIQQFREARGQEFQLDLLSQPKSNEEPIADAAFADGKGRVALVEFKQYRTPAKGKLPTEVDQEPTKRKTRSKKTPE